MPPHGPSSLKRLGVSPARLVAWRALAAAWDPKGVGVTDLVDEQSTALRLDTRDRALARELAFGVLRNRLSLELELAKHLQEPIVSKSARAHDALLLGAYQLLHLDRVPPHAAVSESVELLSDDKRAERFKALANAVLRKVAQAAAAPRGEQPPWPIRQSMPQPVLDAVALALPPEELEAFAKASNRPAPLCLRLTRLGREDPAFMKFTNHGILRVAGEPLPFRRSELAGTDCLIVDQGGVVPREIQGFSEGFLTVEDEGAQIAALFAASCSQGPVLDLCASPGGKTSHLADTLSPDTSITASDLNQAKLDRLEETLKRLGLSGRIEKMVSSRILGGSFNQSFATVLVDAPCSGLGTLRRHPEIRYRFAGQGREQVAGIQTKLLKDAARLIAPGGLLVYTVCSVNPVECEEQVERFLATHRDFRPDPAPEGLPFDPAKLACGPGMWRTWPHRHGCDGFFIARFRRASGAVNGG